MNTSIFGRLGRLVNFAPHLTKSQHSCRLHLQEKVNRSFYTGNTILCNKTPNNNSSETEGITKWIVNDYIFT